MSKKIITKNQLITVLKRWSDGEISTETMQIWMLDNFEPDDFIIGDGERQSVIDAMHVVMNEYELAAPDKCLQQQGHLAIAFIDAQEHNFEQFKTSFLRHSFCD